MNGAMAGPRWAWRFGKRDGGCNSYTLGYYRPLRWEFSDGCRGSWARTPWGAVLRWQRWRKQDAAGLIPPGRSLPDYEAAKRAFELEFPCHCGPAFTDRDLHASDCVFDESESVVPIVDAALADYLTEEDRP